MMTKNTRVFVSEFSDWNSYSFFPSKTFRTFSPPLLHYTEVQRAVETFHRDGFVVLVDGLSITETERLGRIVKQKADEIVAADLDGKIAPETKHGDMRYSFGEYGQSTEWEYLATNERVLSIIRNIWGGRAFRAVGAGGDFVLPGGTWQGLHNDNSWRAAGEPVPRVITVNYYVSEVSPECGPIRIVPGTARFPVPNSRVTNSEPEWMRRAIVTGKAGYAVIRDPRAWHGGTPNNSSSPRYMPNLEYVLRDAPLDEVGGTLARDLLNGRRWIAEFGS
jgi:ectoine hydroxylase-related dioxygenase (phytanoyl-CoA dioxygenase family)